MFSPIFVPMKIKEILTELRGVFFFFFFTNIYIYIYVCIYKYMCVCILFYLLFVVNKGEMSVFLVMNIW
jgi:hypothetical protein